MVRAGSRTDEHGRTIGRFRRIGVRSNQLVDEPSWHEQNEIIRGRKESSDRPISHHDAKELWEAEVKALPETYTEPVYLVTGIVLPIWDRIGGPPRVYRVQTTVATEAGEADERMIGRLIAPDHLESTLRSLGAESEAQDLDPAALADRILAGAKATLANGWYLRRRRASGEMRIELVGAPPDTHRQLSQDGLFAEIHQWTTRIYVPTGARAGEVLARLIEHRPVVEVTSAE